MKLPRHEVLLRDSAKLQTEARAFLAKFNVSSVKKEAGRAQKDLSPDSHPDAKALLQLILGSNTT
eukprot:5289242-Alexandrium_andersonii.AAC.1